MASDLPQRPVWYKALNLLERARAGRPAAAADTDGRGVRRLAQWRAQPPFDLGDLFERRLALDGLDEQILVQLLGESPDALAERFAAAPQWLTAVAGLVAPGLPSDAPELAEVSQLVGSAAGQFLPAALPLLAHARARLRKGIRAIAGDTDAEPPDAAAAAETFLIRELAERLLGMMERTLVLELNVARLRNQLHGDTPEARFESFVSRIGEEGVRLDLLQEYPVLARQLCSAVDAWAESSLEFLRRLAEDRAAVGATFDPARSPGPLVKLHSAGDRHRGGRAVVVAEFASGLRVLYKPRSLAVDVRFQQLLAWVNARGQSPPLRTLRVLDRGDYGWCEHVEHKECESIEALRRFYRRQGSNLAILHLLHATDFHHENVIAAGEHPVLVDLESLFHPHFVAERSVAPGDAAGALLSTSVLRVGLLPSRSWADDSTLGIDISGLGAPEGGQMSPRPAAFWEGHATDAMRISRKPRPIEGSANRPRLQGADVDVTGFQPEIGNGFSETYRLLLKHRAELGAAEGPLVAFAGDEVRVLLRPTHLYAVLLRDGYHPNVLRDALDRDRFFDRLWATVERTPYVVPVIAAERDDLWRDDVPRFTMRPGSPDLWTSATHRIENFFPRAGMSLVMQRLQEMGEADLARQRWLIDASFTAVAVGRVDAAHPTYSRRSRPRAASADEYVAAAVAVGDRLADLALWGQEGASWIGLKPVHERYWNLAPLGLDLYSGLPGVALFLAHLAAVSGEERHRRLTRGALTTMLHQIEHGEGGITRLGAFTGWGGVVYALAHLEQACGRADLAPVTERIVRGLPEQIERDRNFDVVGGTAGCLAALLALHHTRPDAATLDVAIRCGDHLIGHAQAMECGIGWTTPVGPAPLAGFSHGAAGIAWALLSLWGATGMPRFRSAALSAIEYERTLFSPAAQNWRDLRSGEEPERSLAAWCHGAAGIGMSRIAMLPYLDAPSVRDEIDAAVGRTRSSFGTNHSLCHGDLGNLELLLLARRAGLLAAGDPLVGRVGAGVLQSIRDDGYLCGVPLGVETPGLMTGLAGIGYGLLRLARPDAIPSLLVLEPPLAAARAAAVPVLAAERPL